MDLEVVMAVVAVNTCRMFSPIVQVWMNEFFIRWTSNESLTASGGSVVRPSNRFGSSRSIHEPNE